MVSVIYLMLLAFAQRKYKIVGNLEVCTEGKLNCTSEGKCRRGTVQLGNRVTGLRGRRHRKVGLSGLQAVSLHVRHKAV
jgi:hypothetical protein